MHTKWVIPLHMSDDAVVWGKARATAAHSQRSGSSSGSAPPNCIAQFLGQAHSAMMKAISFNFTQNHDVVSRLISSKNQLKARLRSTDAGDVSDDECLPAAPPTDYGFPSGPDWADFFDEASGGGVHDDDDDE